MVARTAVSPCYFYILAFVDGRYYTGLTNDIQRRLKEHKGGQCVSTRHSAALSMCYAYLCTTRLQARTFEVIVKNRGASKWLSTNSRKMYVVYNVDANKFPAK